jgi:hypothetical protein
MTPAHIATLRLYVQHIAQADFTSAEQVVSWMGAMQAQDYPGALWSVALRTPNLTQADVEQAIIDRKIVRSWPMRGTLHFMSAKDARWMVNLLAPRVIAASKSRRAQLEIDEPLLTKVKTIFEQSLSGEKCLSRSSMMTKLEEAGISTANQRGYHLLVHFAQTGLICFGPHEDKQPTFVLMDEWLPETPSYSREEALKELARRFFVSHGPATIHDFAGWANITLSDARAGLGATEHLLTSETVEGKTYWFSPTLRDIKPKPTTFLLPGFDEFMLGYKDRSPALAVIHSQKIVPGNNGMFMPTIVVNGQIDGLWKRTTRVKSTQIELLPFESLTKETRQSLQKNAARYGEFLQKEVTIL